jgi:hypothetical protein
MPPLKAIAVAQKATAVLVRQGNASEAVSAMVIPAQRGVLFAVAGGDRELYVNGQALPELPHPAPARPAPCLLSRRVGFVRASQGHRPPDSSGSWNE